MSTSFPTSLQDLDATRGSGNDTLSSPSHVTHHTNEDDTIEALQAKVGIDSSAVTTSLDYLIKNSSSVDPGHKHSTSGLSVTGTPTISTYLRGDNTWATRNDKFSGTGSDGAFSVSSGTTTIDCANAVYVIKNFTSFSLTGTGKLAFSNPNSNGTVVIIKVIGDVTISSSTVPSIDCTNLGAAGGIAATNGTDGKTSYVGTNPTKGLKGLDPVSGDGGDNAGGSGGSVVSPLLLTNFVGIHGSLPLLIGAGGGGGGGNNGGVGGNGGGVLIINCGGSYTCSSTLSSAGSNGANGSSQCGGGGGGGGGSIIVLYNTLTSDSGTYTVSGGTGGTGGGGGSFTTGGSGGGGGGSNTAGADGAIGGGSGHGGTSGYAGNGGTGGNGISVVAKNYSFT